LSALERGRVRGTDAPPPLRGTEEIAAERGADTAAKLGDAVSTPISLAIASRWAMRFSVAGWVENRLSPLRFMPGTM